MAVARQVVNDELSHYYFVEYKWENMERGDLKVQFEGRDQFLVLQIGKKLFPEYF